jgi:chromosome segregation ATPase
MGSNNERENSTDTLIAVFSEKIEQLITSVNEIKNNLLTTRDDVREMQLKIRDLENISKNQQKEIDEQRNKTDSARKTAVGALITVGTGLTIAFLKVVLGV